MSKPVLLDLFCGAGGAAAGYYTIGFEVIGVDNQPQPNYPFQFIQADWRDVVGKVAGVDAIHASPPCQAYSGPKSVNGDRGHIGLLPDVIDYLDNQDKPYVIENVVQAPLRQDLLLCGTMFRRPFLRHRIFQTNFPIEQPRHSKHEGRVRGWRHGKYYDGPYLAIYGKGGGKATLEEARVAMNCEWMKTWSEVVEAVPPCYTTFIGMYIRDELRARGRQTIGTGAGHQHP